jgi:protein-disulfide isomerase-like protein with CxxC motif
MAVTIRYITDPGCSWSWSTEPVVRRLMTEFGDELSWTFVMGGLARDYESGGEGVLSYRELVEEWLDVADEGGMPIDPRLWIEGPIRTTYPACMAVRAAAEQAGDGGYAYLRALREGLLCFRRKLDTTEALVEEARRVRLDVQRFRIDLDSHATVEAFGRDLDEARDVPGEARAAGQVKRVEGKERVSFPTMAFVGEAGGRRWVCGYNPYEVYREAALALGAAPRDGEPPGVLDALVRFGRMATLEVEAVCGLAGPQAAAELWRLASEWRAKPVRVLTGHLWEPA